MNHLYIVKEEKLCHIRLKLNNSGAQNYKPYNVFP
jgi:hypothetical protein